MCRAPRAIAFGDAAACRVFAHSGDARSRKSLRDQSPSPIRVAISFAFSFARAERETSFQKAVLRNALRYFTKARAAGARHDRPMPPIVSTCSGGQPRRARSFTLLRRCA